MRIILDDGTGEDFDRLLGIGNSETLKDNADLTLVTKEKATKAGRPVVLLTFTVEDDLGRLRRVQTVCTMEEFIGAAVAFQSRCGV